MKKIISILKEAFPVILMIGLIPWVTDDFILSMIYIVLIIAAFAIKRQKGDGAVFFFGLIALTISEYFFISTGVETFTRNSLFGTMPLWLPLLWAYGFVAIKRSIKVLE